MPRGRFPVKLAEPTIIRSSTGTEIDRTYELIPAWASQQQRPGREQEIDGIESGTWVTLFTVRWPHLKVKQITEQWKIFDKYNVQHDVISVTQNSMDWSSVDVLAERHELTDIPEERTVSPPVPTIRVRAGWSTDRTPEAVELTAESTSSVITIPSGTGALFLVLWRPDAAGGDPTNVFFVHGANLRNEFGEAEELIFPDDDGVTGQAIVTVFDRNADLLSNTPITVA